MLEPRYVLSIYLTVKNIEARWHARRNVCPKGSFGSATASSILDAEPESWRR